MEELAAPENLLTAWRAVRGNIPSYRRQRSAGPDGVTLVEFERDLQAQLSALRHTLLKGHYQPQPPGLFSVKKRSGGTRQLAILNVADRVAQRAAQQTIEPLYEPAFLPCSFGFRPGRSTYDAIYCARRLRSCGYGWVVDGDIASCFDSLDHHLLMDRINKRIKDERVLDLLQKWLKIGVLEHGLPGENVNWLAEGWEKASHGLRRGFDWTLDTLNQQQRVDPYSEARYEQPGYHARPSYESDEGDELPSHQSETQGSFYDFRNEDYVERTSRQKMAFQQMAAGGLLLGTSWLRQNLSHIGPAALAALKSQAGREILKHGLLVGGGVVGTTAGLALTAYFLYRQARPTPIGVIQGSPISPLLANIYLHSFDLALTQAGYRLVRFADDWVILCPDQNSAEMAYNQSIVALSQIHLKVNSEKTHILPPTDPLEWLGEVIA
ncbi:MAG: reverse transcriptase domain-containing protein [Bacteroidales bacterium]